MARSRRSILLTIIAILAVLAIGVYGGLEHYKVQLYLAANHARAEDAGLSKHQVQAGAFNIVYLENNLRGKKPTLLMVHGFSANKESWLDLALQLKNDFHMIALDLPGHGESSQPLAQSYTMEIQVKRLHDFMAAIGVDHFSIIGSSMGGGITALYAAAYPDQVQSVLLMDPAGIIDVASDYTRALDEGKNPLIASNPQEFDAMMGYVMVKKPFIPWPFTEVAVEKMQQRLPINQKIFNDIISDSSDDFKQAIVHITAPTLVGWGDSDRVIAPGNSEIFKRLIPHAQIHLFKQVGHAPMIEVPQECAQVVRSFIDNAIKTAAR